MDSVLADKLCPQSILIFILIDLSGSLNKEKAELCISAKLQLLLNLSSIQWRKKEKKKTNLNKCFSSSDITVKEIRRDIN